MEINLRVCKYGNMKKYIFKEYINSFKDNKTI